MPLPANPAVLDGIYKEQHLMPGEMAKNNSVQINTTHITTAQLTAQTSQTLAASLQTFFPKAIIRSSDVPEVGKGAWVQIAADLTSWRLAFESAAHIYCDDQHKHESSLLQEVANTDDADDADGTDVVNALHCFYQALAAADADVVSSAQGRLTLHVTITSQPSPDIKLDFNVHDQHHFLNLFARFITLATVIHHTAAELSQSQAIECDEFQCTCKQRPGFELKWLDAHQNRYVNQFFTASGTPTSAIEIMHNG